MARKLESASDVAARILPSTVGSRAFIEIGLAWPKVVGEYLASQCRPVAFTSRELIIEVADEMVATEMRFGEDELRGKLARWLRPKTRLRIVVRHG